MGPELDVTNEVGIWLLASLEVVAAIAIASFWRSWFREAHDQDWLPPGYILHERAFIWSDALLALLLVVSAILLTSGHRWGRSLSLVSAGMLAFLGVLDAAYFWQNGLFKAERGGVGNLLVVAAVLALSAVLVIGLG